MKFFEDVFNWTFQQFGDQEYWFASRGNESPGINGAFMKKRDPQTNSISVKVIDQSIRKIENSGGMIVVPKMPIPTMGLLAFFKDPDGNIHGIWQDDKEAN